MTDDILSRIGNTPLVRMDRIAGTLRVPLFAKCEFLNPGGSVKDRIAKSIIEDGEARGELQTGATLVEATAGNTGIGLAIVAASRGYRLVCVLPEKMSIDKRIALSALGSKVVVVPNASLGDPDNFRRTAERMAAENGWYLTRQFEHPANPRIHEETTGPEILEQCNGRVGAFVCGVGTGGTITGVGRYLKRHSPGVKIVMADPVGSRLAHLVDPRWPDLDAPFLVEGIGGSEPPKVLDLSVVDDAEVVADDESFTVAGRLLREEGLLVGGSSGTAVAAALRIAERGSIDGPIVVLLPDSWDRYYSQPWVKALATREE